MRFTTDKLVPVDKLAVLTISSFLMPSAVSVCHVTHALLVEAVVRQFPGLEIGVLFMSFGDIRLPSFRRSYMV